MNDLRSLNRLSDVVFGLMGFSVMGFLPSFQDGHWLQLRYGILSLLASQPANLTRVVFGLIVVIYYWSRKNAVLGLVEKSDTLFATLSLASLAFIGLFLYALVADPTYTGGPPTLLLQSASLAIAGLLGYAALRHAMRADLIRPEMRASVGHVVRVDLSNPLTAIIATALSWSGLTIWTISWFVLMPLLGWFLGRSPAKS